MRVLLAGGTGLIGTALREKLSARGWESRILTRGPVSSDVGWRWAPSTASIDTQSIEWADAVVNLAGASISRMPWTRARRDDILRSRITSTATLVAAIDSAVSAPHVLVNGSAVGFYGNRPGERLTEASARGDGFLSDVVEVWERTAVSSRARVVHARTGVVFSPRGGVLPLLLGTTRWFAGTRFGSGTQVWPWISLDDEARALMWVIENQSIEGAVNLVAPASDSASVIARRVANHLRRPVPFVAPRFAVDTFLGAAGRELLLADQEVSPDVLQSSGFTFVKPTLDSVLQSV